MENSNELLDDLSELNEPQEPIYDGVLKKKSVIKESKPVEKGDWASLQEKISSKK